MVRDQSALKELWCEDKMKWAEGLNGTGLANTTHTCSPMSLQVGNLVDGAAHAPRHALQV